MLLTDIAALFGGGNAVFTGFHRTATAWSCAPCHSGRPRDVGGFFR